MFVYGAQMITSQSNRSRVKAEKKAPPGPPGHPLWGNLFEFRRNQLDFVIRMSREYGGVVHIGNLFSNDFIITDPAYAQRILIDNKENYTNQTFEYNGAERLFGHSLFLLEGSSWGRRRRLLQAAFQQARDSRLSAVVQHHAATLLERWDGATRQSEPLDIEAELRRFTLVVAGEYFLGVDLSATIDPLAQIFSTVNERGDLAQNAISLGLPFVPTRANREYRAAIRELDQFMYGVIAKRRRELAHAALPVDQRNDLLTQLILARDEQGAALTDTELRDECVTFLFDGSETTSNALAWLWWLLGSHPPAMQKLQDELQQVLRGRAPDMADLPQLSYTRMCYEEALRLYPPSHLMSRRARHEDELGGYCIPAKSNLVVNIYGMHRRPDIWPEPDEFQPERFESRRISGRHKLAFLPFGAGPRMCIGYQFSLIEAQLITATLAQRFHARPVAGQLVAADALITLRPHTGFLMQIQRI